MMRKSMAEIQTQSRWFRKAETDNEINDRNAEIDNGKTTDKMETQRTQTSKINEQERIRVNDNEQQLEEKKDLWLNGCVMNKL